MLKLLGLNASLLWCALWWFFEGLEHGSIPPSKRIDLNSYGSRYGARSPILKVVLSPYSAGMSTLKALLPFSPMILEGPITFGMSLFFLWSGNLSFLRCTHTRSPICRLLLFVLRLSALALYLMLALMIFSWNCLWIFRRASTCCLALGVSFYLFWKIN